MLHMLKHLVTRESASSHMLAYGIYHVFENKALDKVDLLLAIKLIWCGLVADSL